MLLPTMKKVANKLKEHYKLSVHAKIQLSSAISQHPNIVDRKTKVRVHPNKMIHFTPSPDYCKPNAAYNIKGTAGRDCTLDKNQTSSSHHCNNLCCDHGYEEYKQPVAKLCNCKFVWCCEVRCNTCFEHKIRHKCKSSH